MRVFQIISKLFFLLVTFLIFFSVFVIVIVKFRSGTEFSDGLRQVVIKSPLLVRIINLNQPGDARYVYLNSKEINIPIELRVLRTSDIENDTNDWIAEMIFQTLIKDVDINTSILGVNEQRSFSDVDLNEIRGRYVDRFELGPKLYIFYLTKHAEMESNIGITLHRDTIFIFKDAIEALTSETETLKRLERSTLMHEWGHLLGLTHIDNPNCIMSDFVEVEERFLYRGEDIPVTYCPETIQKLNKLIRN